MKTDKTAPTPVTIEQVENGYLLTSSFDTEARYPHRQAAGYERRQPHVFPSLGALFEHLAQHFTYRCTRVAMDPAPPPPMLGTLPAGTIVTPNLLNQLPDSGVLRNTLNIGAQAAEGIARLQDHVWSAIEPAAGPVYDPNVPLTVDVPGFKNFGHRE